MSEETTFCCYREWQAFLARPLHDICHILETDSERSRRLRQNSPFAGVLPASENLVHQGRERHAKTAA
jgi:hypothetical protein